MKNGWIWASDGKFAVRFEIRDGVVSFPPPMFYRSRGKHWRDIVRYMEYKGARVEIYKEE